MTVLCSLRDRACAKLRGKWCPNKTCQDEFGVRDYRKSCSESHLNSGPKIFEDRRTGRTLMQQSGARRITYVDSYKKLNILKRPQIFYLFMKFSLCESTNGGSYVCGVRKVVLDCVFYNWFNWPAKKTHVREFKKCTTQQYNAAVQHA